MSDTDKKKIVIINGSPKREKSVTFRVAREFVDGIKSVNDCDVDVINVSDLNIKPCMGCLSCWCLTDGQCVIQNDDMPWVKAMIEAADVVVESYPLYFFGMPGIMKLFTDRLLGMLNTYVGQEPILGEESMHGIRHRKPGQKLVIVSSCAYSDTRIVYEPLLKQYDCICGVGKYTAILCPQLQTTIDLGESNRLTRYLKRFSNAGRAFAENGALTEEQLKFLSTPPFSQDVYKTLLAKFWDDRKKGIRYD